VDRIDERIWKNLLHGIRAKSFATTEDAFLGDMIRIDNLNNLSGDEMNKKFIKRQEKLMGLARLAVRAGCLIMSSVILANAFKHKDDQQDCYSRIGDMVPVQ